MWFKTDNHQTAMEKYHYSGQYSYFELAANEV